VSSGGHADDACHNKSDQGINHPGTKHARSSHYL
jgi:hypothetical protein